MEHACSIIMTAVANEQEAEKISTLLVSRKLAACVQMLPMQSCYRWKGEIVNDTEVLLLIKTRSELYQEVETAILENHSYELPEIVQIPIEQGFDPYLQWMTENTT
jgi:periplasmic divalent cation tolerance protein